MTAGDARRDVAAALVAAPVDVLVVGGGIVGCGIARDAALRGMSVALIEQHDFAGGTTSRPTRLIHGGLRYLEILDFGLVRSDLREREILLRVAPHLVFPLRFLMPHHDDGFLRRTKLHAGMALYDLLSFDKSLPGRRWLSRAEMLAEEPTMRADGLQGGWSFYDAQVPRVERLVVENVIDAATAGALVMNHARAERFVRDPAGGVTGAIVRDLVAGRELAIRARVTVNATGAWLDITNRDVVPGRPRALRLTKGVHLVTPSGTRNAVLQFAESDHRIFFVTPWLGCSLVGTTDTDYVGDPADVDANEEDVRYLKTEARRAFPTAPFDTVHYVFAGVRALVRVEGVAEGEVSRKHAIVDHERRDRVPGLVSVLGGKITAFRAVAEEVVDVVSGKLGRVATCATGRRPLPGGAFAGRRELLEGEVSSRAHALGLAREQSEHLMSTYGSLAHEVLDLVERDRALGERVCPHHATILGQLVRAMEHEWAASLADVLLRRTTLGLEPGQAIDCVGEIAERLGCLMGWDAADCAAQVADYMKEIAPMRRFASPPLLWPSTSRHRLPPPPRDLQREGIGT